MKGKEKNLHIEMEEGNISSLLKKKNKGKLEEKIIELDKTMDNYPFDFPLQNI